LVPSSLTSKEIMVLMPCLSGPMTYARGGAVRFRANRALCCLKASGDPAEQRARGRRHAPPLPPDLRATPGRRCAASRLAGMPGLGLGIPTAGERRVVAARASRAQRGGQVRVLRRRAGRRRTCVSGSTA
jgi:hypothetical protein